MSVIAHRALRVAACLMLLGLASVHAATVPPRLKIYLSVDDVRVIRSWPRHGGMMAGRDGSFDAALAEIRAQLPHVETVETKKALSFHAASSLTPAESARRIAIGVRAALKLSYLCPVERVDAHTIRFTSSDMAEVSDFVSVVDSYSPELVP